MFGPKHTFESVAKELVDGLEDGTVSLHPEEPTEADVEKFKSMVNAILARNQRIYIVLWIFTALLIMTAVLLPDILPPKNQPPTGSRYHALVELSLGVLIGIASSLVALKIDKRSVELKTFIQILKMVDATTAKRLVLWEGARLQRRRWGTEHRPSFP